MNGAELQVPDRGAAGIPPVSVPQIEWPIALSILAYGVRVAVRTNDPSIGNLLAAHLPPGCEVEEFSEGPRVYSIVAEEVRGSTNPRYSVFADGAVRTRRRELAAALRAFEADVQIHVAEMSPEHVFVHAGVVGWRGGAILLPGRSFSGKSTLVAALVRAGAEYYSDEYAVLDPAGGVHPYPRALSIRQPAGVLKCRVDVLGGREGTGPLPARLVVVSRFTPRGEWRPQVLTPGRGALALLANTVPARRIPGIVMSTIERVVSVATVVSSDRGEASSVVEPILELAAQGWT